MGITITGNTPTVATTYRYWKDGSTEYREGIRNGVLYTDKLLPGGSWSQAKDVGWEVVRSAQ